MECALDKLKEIETFVSVAANGSFSAAAAGQNVTPVMIGRRISHLEKRLGGKLFHRSTRKLTLTEEGLVFFELCHGMLGRLEAAERLVMDAQQRAAGHLIVSCPASFGRKHIAPHLHEFLAGNPDVRISLNLSDHVVDLVREGYDMGIRIGVLPEPNLTSISLAPDQAVVCGTPGYFEKHGIPRTPEDLTQHNCLTFNQYGGQPHGWYFKRNGQQISIKVAGNLASNDGALLRQWAVEGLGLAWSSKWEVATLIQSGELITVLDDYVFNERVISAVHPRQNNLPAKTSLFIDWLKSVYSRPGYWGEPSL
jgi:DNA-binding transcriptional LysR family regulator